MLKKTLYSLIGIVFIGVVAWEYKVNILIWSIPKVTSILMPIQENIPTSWSEGPAVASEDERPNIILILADDMGYNDISMHNGGAADGSLKTTNIDSLAESGIFFSRGYAANATCAPSRASIMTGKYPTRFGYEFTPVPATGRLIMSWLAEEDDAVLKARIDNEVARNLPPLWEQGMPTEQITIAEVLRDSGYYTAHIGKWHLGHANGMDPLSQGFEDSLSLVGPLYAPEDDPEIVNAKFDTGIDRMIWGMGQYSARFNEGELFAPDKYVTDYYTDEALKVIEKNKNRPFFLYFSHWAVHNPLQALRSDVEQMSHMAGHNLQVYSGMIAALDRSVGKVVAKLKELEIHGKTLIIFTSDNGPERTWSKRVELYGHHSNGIYREGKRSIYEGGHRVPFLICWPDKVKAGSRWDGPVCQTDLLATFADMLDIKLPDNAGEDSDSFFDALTGAKEIAPRVPMVNHSSQGRFAVREGKWKLVMEDTKKNKRELFDLSSDPKETKNIISDHRDIESELTGKLTDLINRGRSTPGKPQKNDTPNWRNLVWMIK